MYGKECIVEPISLFFVEVMPKKVNSEVPSMKLDSDFLQYCQSEYNFINTFLDIALSQGLILPVLGVLLKSHFFTHSKNQILIQAIFTT